MEKFAIGLIIGGIGGALLAANNYKMRTLIKKAQEEVMAKVDDFMDEKIQAMEEGAQEFKEKTEDAAENLKRKARKTFRKATENAEN